MRKHNTKFAQRWSRAEGDRSNFPQMMAHGFVKDKQAQLMANGLLRNMLKRIGIDVAANTLKRMMRNVEKLEATTAPSA